MRNLILGIIITLAGFRSGGLAFATFGLMPTNADATPPQLETRIAMNALDASMDRHAPRVSNPLPPTDENLIEGMKLYTMNCAVCHGTLDNKPSPLENSFYPPVPQIDPGSARRSRVAHLLCRPHWRALHRHARLEQGAQRPGDLEGDRIPFPHSKTAAQGAGLLEESLRCRPAAGRCGKGGH